MTTTGLKERDAWMRALLKSGLHDTAQRVGVRLALHLNITTGRLDPSYDKLSAELGGKPAPRQIKRWVNHLVEHGWIERDGRPGTTNSFHLLPPPDGGRGVIKTRPPGVSSRRHPSESFGGVIQTTPPGVSSAKGRGDAIDDTPGVSSRRHPNRVTEQNPPLAPPGGRTEEVNRGTREDARPVAHSLSQEPPDGYKVHPVTGELWRPNPDRLTREDCLAINDLCDAWERGDITEEDLDREEAKIRERARRRPRRKPRLQPEDGWPDDYRRQFWDAYPHKVGKKPALAALGRLRRRKQGRPTWAELIDGVHRYVAYMRKLRCPVDKYLNPKTWITEERWNDEPAR